MIQILQGVDIVEITKFRDIFLRNNGFVSDIFTEQETAYCRSRMNPHVHFAGRFAAKEACMKAFGTGLSGLGIPHIFREIEVAPDVSGKPQLFVNGWLSKIAKKKKIGQFSVSISHAADYAVATVILVGAEGLRQQER